MVVGGIIFYTKNHKQSQLKTPPQARPAPQVEQPKQEREFFGLIRRTRKDWRITSTVPFYLDVDEVDWLYGEAATLAVMEDKKCPREKVEDCISTMANNFYIRNVSSAITSYVVDSSTSVRLLENPGSPNLVSSTPASFTAAFKNPDLLLNKSPFYFRAVSGTQILLDIEQQYLP